ncbi:MAG: class I SAM-dependent methyltransferase [Deltaproteobacteria bacterium]|nr:class I SAM-dependent methyltransferase [Deltaproteobacteria bacterium]
MNEEKFHDDFYNGAVDKIFSSSLYQLLLNDQRDFLFNHSKGCQNGAILSVACGDGVRELGLSDRVHSLVGIDISAVAIDKARSAAQKSNIDHFKFVVADARSLENYQEHFDTIWCCGFLHHLTEDVYTEQFNSLWRALKHGGRLITSDPNALRLVNVFKVFFRKKYNAFHSPDERELKPGDVVMQFKKAQFENIQVSYSNFFISPLAWLFPKIPKSVATVLFYFDRLLTRIPLFNRLSSGCFVVGEKK